MTQAEFGTFLKEQREKAGKTQAEVAEAIGYSSPQFISNVERGLCNISKPKFRHWAKAIGVQPVTLFAKYQRVKIAYYEQEMGLRR